MLPKSLVSLCFGLACITYWLIYRARRRHDYHQITLASAMKHMKTGDLILFSGRDFSGNGIVNKAGRALFLSITYLYRGLEASEWGHVAVVYKDDKGNLYLMHSVMHSAQPDLFSQDMVPGVQVNALEPIVNAYRGYCLWRPINKALPSNKVMQFLKRTFHQNYSIPLDIWKRFLERWTGQKYGMCHSNDDSHKADNQGGFCSEWVGTLLEYCEVFDKTRRPVNGYYFPGDFTVKRSQTFLPPSRRYDYPSEGLEIVTVVTDT